MLRGRLPGPLVAKGRTWGTRYIGRKRDAENLGPSGHVLSIRSVTTVARSAYAASAKDVTTILGQQEELQQNTFHWVG